MAASKGKAKSEGDLFFWVSRYYEASRRAMTQAFRESKVDLSPEHWLAIAALAENGPSLQGVVGAAMHRDAPTTSRIIDTMERLGYLTRQPDPEDKRAHRLTLTKKGKDIHRSIGPVAKRVTKMLEAGASSRELAAARRALQGLVEKLEA